MINTKFRKSQVQKPPWKRINLCVSHVTKVDLKNGLKIISRKATSSNVSLRFPCVHTSLSVTAREAGSILFWAAIEIISSVFRNQQVTYFNPNTTKRARPVFIQVFLSAPTPAPAPAVIKYLQEKISWKNVSRKSTPSSGKIIVANYSEKKMK